MNFIVICLHCLDMRDFHSTLRNTPFLDKLREKSIFIPMGRAQGHHSADSLNAEMTGVWTAKFCDSILTERGYKAPNNFKLPKTVIEYLREHNYDIFTRIEQRPAREGMPNPIHMGTDAVKSMEFTWLKNEPERLKQFYNPDFSETCNSQQTDLDELLQEVKRSKKFYLHLFLRSTHRCWDQLEGLCALVGKPPAPGWPEDAFCARKAALEKPDEFAALRRRGLANADRVIKKIFDATQDIKDVAYIIYSNHGEVFDHFRYHFQYENGADTMVVGTSHGNYPYEVLYANMQIWIIPGYPAKVIKGIGRSIDFAPTIMEIAGIEPEQMDGESMLKYFSSGIFPESNRYAESVREDGCISMVRKDGYKFISTGIVTDNNVQDKVFSPTFHKLAVFDLSSDPYEYVNLINTQEGRKILGWAIDKHRELKRESPYL